MPHTSLCLEDKLMATTLFLVFGVFHLEETHSRKAKRSEHPLSGVKKTNEGKEGETWGLGSKRNLPYIWWLRRSFLDGVI